MYISCRSAVVYRTRTDLLACLLICVAETVIFYSRSKGLDWLIDWWFTVRLQLVRALWWRSDWRSALWVSLKGEKRKRGKIEGDEVRAKGKEEEPTRGRSRPQLQLWLHGAVGGHGLGIKCGKRWALPTATPWNPRTREGNPQQPQPSCQVP